jgi:hypothetical protein
VLAEIVLDTDAEAVPGALLARISTESTSVRAEPVEASVVLMGPSTGSGGTVEVRHPIARRHSG